MNFLPEKSLCFGCGACVCACPQKALSMAEDAEGFIYPRLDQEKCNKCEICGNMCPALKNQFKPHRSKVRRAVAVRSGAYASASASGGAFAAFAHNIISDDGFAAGAVYDTEWKVAHIISNKTDNINKMRGSKYQQSDTKDTFTETQSLLENNKKVLFSGTPCQIAGLYGFLGKDYNNLLTVDLICHGVNSPFVWKKYLNELELQEGSKIISIIQRNKAVNIPNGNNQYVGGYFTVDFANGKKIAHDSFNENEFMKGFWQHLFIRPCCCSCPYTGRIRPGDMSIGDLWTHEAAEDRKDGISQVLINSKKGRIFFDTLESSWIKKYPVNLSRAKYFTPNINGICVSNYNPHRKRFFDLCQIMSYTKALDYTINNKYEIAIIGMHDANYGNLLTAYAMYKVISDMGKTALMLDRPLTSVYKPSKEHFKIFSENPYPDYALSDIYPDKNSMKELNDRIGVFLLPSDQNLKPFLFLRYDKYTLLDWVRDDKPKISYASSFGTSFFEGDDNVRAEMGYYLSRFDAISVREESGIQYAKDNFGLDAEQTLDPVFLCPPEIFYEMANNHKSSVPKEKFLGSYIIHPSNQMASFIDNVQMALRLENDCTLIAASWTYIYGYGKILWKKNFLEKAFVEDFLACVQGCECFITDSFHGVCFSIIFRKNFIVIYDDNVQLKSHTRFYDLLRKLGLENRILSSLDEKEGHKLLQKDINYDEVYAVLHGEIIRSRTWLNNTVNKASSIKRNMSAYDIIDNKLQEFEYIKSKCKKKVSARKMLSDIWIIRKIKGFFRNLKIFGFAYTIKLLRDKLKNYRFIF
jgi:coenzyme F420-reducing hydrogenase beta subunit